MASIAMTHIVEDDKGWKKLHELLRWRQIDLNTNNGSKDHLSALPLEVLKSIYEYLDPVEATCLGLAGKVLYPMHKILHKIPLALDTPWRRGLAGSPTMLYGFLEGWAERQNCKLFRQYSGSETPRLIFDKLPGGEDDTGSISA